MEGKGPFSFPCLESRVLPRCIHSVEGRAHGTLCHTGGLAGVRKGTSQCPLKATTAQISSPWTQSGPNTQSRGKASPRAVVSGGRWAEENVEAGHTQGRHPPWNELSFPWRPYQMAFFTHLVTRITYTKGRRWGSRSKWAEVSEPSVVRRESPPGRPPRKCWCRTPEPAAQGHVGTWPPEEVFL